ncbi:MAG: tetratricopeptide repeat protein [Spirochaetia bacterium]|jgi:tetratricopeptide (TPR) repeat protein|nr:tetratricopeptide repeat protein [Spirochaetia bacterium]
MKHLLFFCIIFASAVYGYSADLKRTGPRQTSAFYSYGEITGWSVIVIGEVDSIGVSDIPQENDLKGYIGEKTKLTARLYSNEGVKTGDELFVMDKNNLINGRVKVAYIYKSTSFGYMLIAYGNFRGCSPGERVVQRASEQYSDYAVVHKSRGDYFREKGDDGRAMAEYKKALALDNGSPEVHLSMGEIYLKQGMLQYAFREFSEAKKSLARLYDNEDKYLLFKGMAEIRLREILEAPLTKEKREEFRKDGIAFCKEALIIYPASADANYFLGRFYYKKSMMIEDDDSIARNCFLKVVEAQPQHAGANIALSELYFKHRNREKAEYYALQALKGNPHNSRALEL